MEPGRKIMELRKKLNLTQEELGKAVGVSTQAVSRWENGGAPDVMLLPAIADKLGVSIDTLFGRDGIPHEDPEQIVRTLVNQTPKGKRLATVEKYAWTMIKAIASFSDLDYGLISGFDDVVRWGDQGETIGERLYYCAFGTCEGGLLKASVAADFKYALLMPAPERGFSSVLKTPEAYLRLFQMLLEPHRLDVLIFTYTRRQVPFTPSLAARSLNLDLPETEEILRELEAHAFLHSNEFETENGLVRSYCPREGLALIPFLYFAGELMKEAQGGGIMLNDDTAPLLNGPPGEGNPFADWKAGWTNDRTHDHADQPSYGLYQCAHEKEEKKENETEEA